MVPRGKDSLVPSPRVKSQVSEMALSLSRVFLIQCCIPFSEITFFLVSMGHNLAESIVAMWPSLEPSSRGEGVTGYNGTVIVSLSVFRQFKIPILFCPS